MEEKIIRDYYNSHNMPESLVKDKIVCLKEHPDILKEFVYWIVNRSYMVEECVKVEGYSAKDVAALSKYMNGESAFFMLIELRKNPQKAISMLKKRMFWI